MRNEENPLTDNFSYRIGLDQHQEAVISSHFMQDMSANPSLKMYNSRTFRDKAKYLSETDLERILLPSLSEASASFAAQRAEAAKCRAKNNYRDFGLPNDHSVGPAEYITEVILDRHFVRQGRRNYSKALLHQEIKTLLGKNSRIEMIIPALPFKIASPLKSRGNFPDLAEVNFLLCLYEIALAIELCRAPHNPTMLSYSKFFVLADGTRFNKIVNEPDLAISEYHTRISSWIERLGISPFVEVIDYGEMITQSLPSTVLVRKRQLYTAAETTYREVFDPLFDASSMSQVAQEALTVEPDPELSNNDGRFFSLLKSLVFTIRYTSLQSLYYEDDDAFSRLYREITSRLFVPFTAVSDECVNMFAATKHETPLDTHDASGKECLRQLMLREVWAATILYMAEIKSDRELEADPVLTCFPGRLRWTIHAKAGQLALALPVTMGKAVQAWAGTGVFKLTKKGQIRLSALPVLALEAAGATPVLLRGDQGGADPTQPLFYVYPGIDVSDPHTFALRLKDSLVRTRTS